MNEALCIEDLRLCARRKLPKTIFESMESGSWSEEALRRNRRDFVALALRQKVLQDISGLRTDTTILGTRSTLPFGIGPTGLHGLKHPRGELDTSLAAKQAGIPFCLSMMSTYSIEDVAQATRAPFWFQIFFLRDRGFVREVVARAAAARCTALFITVDLPMRGRRLTDIRNGMTVPPNFTAKNFLEFALKPRWALGAFRNRNRMFGNLQGHVAGLEDADEALKWSDTQYDPTVTWKDIEWIRGLWQGPLVLKGILDAGDAKTAVDVGAQGIVVSNHGGRQLDVAQSTISALPRIADAVGSSLEIMLDGGVRSGQDVLKALGRGARFCLLGRSALYGPAAGGQAGVGKAIDIVRSELVAAMAMTGVTAVEQIDAQVIAE